MARSHVRSRSHLRPGTHLDAHELLPLTPEVEAVYAAAEATLTDEERADMEALHAGLEDGTIVERPDLKAHVEALAHAITAAMPASKRITVRLSSVDLEMLQQKAQEQGLPYQTLLKSVIHQYLTGQLVPRKGLAPRPGR